MKLCVDIQKQLDGFALDVRFEAAAKGTLGILGASGSGKSMTLKCIAGIETPDAGRITLGDRVLFDGHKKINLKPQQRGVGYLFQSYALFPHMTVEKNLLSVMPGPKAGKAEAAHGLLEQFGLAELANRYPAQLSGGQQQRVALARILACKPQALLLDEPFAALDTHLKERLHVEMQALLGAFGGPSLLVTHSRDEAYKLTQSLVVLEEGRALSHGGTRALFQSPGKLATARLTGCKNLAPCRKTGAHQVYVPAWGATLKTATPVGENTTHVGVRAHDFHPAGPDGENRIPVREISRMEAPFEWNILFHATGAEKPGGIWWKLPKQAAPQPPPQALCVHPGDVLVLTE